jgi:glyoxylase-like metal-dependent hydrolase (beta-lactamase superfamily II)
MDIMTKTLIETIPILPFGMVNAFLVIRGRKAILIDTGLPNAEVAIGKALKKHGLGWSNIDLIILTHAHIDHAGSAVAVQALTSAPIIAHDLETPYCRGEAPILKPTGLFGRVFQKTGAIEQPFSYFTPQKTMTAKDLSLEEYGFPARILHTPGHTSGSVSVLLDEGRVIAGDLVASGVLLGGIVFRNRPKSPPFEETPGLVATSLENLLELGCRAFYLGHGGPLGAKQIETHIAALKKLNSCT